MLRKCFFSFAVSVLVAVTAWALNSSAYYVIQGNSSNSAQYVDRLPDLVSRLPSWSGYTDKYVILGMDNGFTYYLVYFFPTSYTSVNLSYNNYEHYSYHWYETFFNTVSQDWATTDNGTRSDSFVGNSYRPCYFLYGSPDLTVTIDNVPADDLYAPVLNPDSFIFTKDGQSVNVILRTSAGDNLFEYGDLNASYYFSREYTFTISLDNDTRTWSPEAYCFQQFILEQHYGYELDYPLLTSYAQYKAADSMRAILAPITSVASSSLNVNDIALTDCPSIMNISLSQLSDAFGSKYQDWDEDEIFDTIVCKWYRVSDGSLAAERSLDFSNLTSIVDETDLSQPDWTKSIYDLNQWIYNNLSATIRGEPYVSNGFSTALKGIGSYTDIDAPDLDLYEYDPDSSGVNFFSWLVNTIILSPFGVILLCAVTFFILRLILG